MGKLILDEKKLNWAKDRHTILDIVDTEMVFDADPVLTRLWEQVQRRFPAIDSSYDAFQKAFRARHKVAGMSSARNRRERKALTLERRYLDTTARKEA